jgi:hypothetical protein
MRDRVIASLLLALVGAGVGYQFVVTGQMREVSSDADATTVYVSEVKAAQARGAIGCQVRVPVLQTDVPPTTWTYGPGLVFDYPAGSSTATVVAFWGEVLRFTSDGTYDPAGGYVQSGDRLVLYDPDGLRFYARGYLNHNSAWLTLRAFPTPADVTLTRELTPFDQWWAAAYSYRYTVPVLVQFVADFLVC